MSAALDYTVVMSNANPPPFVATRCVNKRHEGFVTHAIDKHADVGGSPIRILILLTLHYANARLLSESVYPSLRRIF